MSNRDPFGEYDSPGTESAQEPSRGSKFTAGVQRASRIAGRMGRGIATGVSNSATNWVNNIVDKAEARFDRKYGSGDYGSGEYNGSPANSNSYFNARDAFGNKLIDGLNRAGDSAGRMGSRVGQNAGTAGRLGMQNMYTAAHLIKQGTPPMELWNLSAQNIGTAQNLAAHNVGAQIADTSMRVGNRLGPEGTYKANALTNAAQRSIANGQNVGMFGVQGPQAHIEGRLGYTGLFGMQTPKERGAYQQQLNYYPAQGRQQWEKDRYRDRLDRSNEEHPEEPSNWPTSKYVPPTKRPGTHPGATPYQQALEEAKGTHDFDKDKFDQKWVDLQEQNYAEKERTDRNKQISDENKQYFADNPMPKKPARPKPGANPAAMERISGEIQSALRALQEDPNNSGPNGATQTP